MKLTRLKSFLQLHKYSQQRLRVLLNELEVKVEELIARAINK